MTRLHADQIEVERGIVDVGGSRVDVGVSRAERIERAERAERIERAEGPARFRWKQRNYTVHAVLDHWVEAGNWWRRADRRRSGSGAAAHLPAAPGAGIGIGIDDCEREVWRVEARQLHAGTGAPVGVFDLNYDWSAGRWSLIRVHD